ncbi:Zinc finger CCHC-type and RNA-binding motif-containing protein 1 [Myotis brandtii]|uniref:Zinc finger CCHC-type and RNA-binding motif-containing protein 1 n=1 Tax=Myotis brandtii TaxID=109478 RepID=S7NIL5_MYOBR|nr:Zinc finger CCHC-type and RNA-binding motif-containing protein 1 [Myotis brandtii]
MPGPSPLAACAVPTRTADAFPAGTLSNERYRCEFLTLSASIPPSVWPGPSNRLAFESVFCQMSGGLAPSKSTVYVSNLPFSLTNNDLYRIFSKYGKVVKVTIMKDKDTRKSKGVAFILFLDKDSAQNCTRAINNKQLFGRVIKASIAIDNGRAAEFIRRRNYFDKSKCYECGNSEPPKKKEKKKKKKIPEPEEEMEEGEESEDEGEDPSLDSLSQAIAFQQAKIEEEQKKWKPSSGGPSTSDDSRRPRIKKSTYFSDEEELSD